MTDWIERRIDALIDLRPTMTDTEVVFRLAAFVALFLPVVLPLRIYRGFQWKS